MSRHDFKLFAYTSAAGCRHELLTRARVPGFSNADQGMEDAALAFADSAADHLRSWWARWRLPLDCRERHDGALVAEVGGNAAGDALHQQGLRELEIWTAPMDRGFLAVGVAASEEKFWRGLEEQETRASRPATRRRVYFMTDDDGDGDLRDS